MALLTPRDASQPEVLLFDLDDTIIDYSGSYERSWRAAAGLACEAIAGLRVEALLPAIQASRDRFWANPARAERGRMDLRAASTEVVEGAFEALGVAPPDGVARAVAEDYRGRRDQDLSLFPDARRVLDALLAADFRLGLVTNGSGADQRRKIERFELEPYFEHIQIEGELGVGKPYAAAYEHALSSVGVSAEATWFIGDNIEWDVLAPQQHGMFGVWVSLGRSLLDAGTAQPDHTVEGIADLVEAG